MTFANIQGTRTHFVRKGQGQTVILIPGLGGRLSFWNDVMADLSKRSDVLSFDHPGCGQSTRCERPVSAESLAGLAMALMDHLGIRSASVVGHSFGGAIGQALALDFPDRVDRLVLSSAWARTDPWFQRTFEQRKVILRSLGLRAYARMQSLSVLPRQRFNTCREEVDAFERRAGEESGSPESIIERIDALLIFDRTRELSDLSLPVLITGVADDRVVPIDMSRALADLIPGSTMIEQPGGGHFWPQFDPGAFVSTTRPFLEGLAPGTSFPRVSRNG